MLSDKIKLARRSREWRRNHPGYYKHVDANRRLIRRYGITLVQKENILKLQKGLCALCSRPLSKNLSEVAVDHCHTTKRIRGLVHRGCNVALARLGDSKASIGKLLLYFLPDLKKPSVIWAARYLLEALTETT